MKRPDVVDAVITWVDGYDKAHQQKLKNYLTKKGISRPEAASPTRYNQCGEIDYCVRSLLYFAPWIRTIYIVTDNQVPEIFKRLKGTSFEGRVKLVDHRDIFFDFEHHLPTFNSLTIESVLWRIPGLAKKFIYLNDDCSIIRPMRHEDFFCDDKIVVRGEWKTQSAQKWENRLKNLLGLNSKPIINEHRTVQENSAKLAGVEKQFFHLPHAPAPLKKDTLESFFLSYPELLSQNIQYPIRDLRQFWPISLAMHLEINNKNVVFDKSLETITVNGACHSLRKMQNRLSATNKQKNIAFVCMQSIDIADKFTQSWMLNWLAEKIPTLAQINQLPLEMSA